MSYSKKACLNGLKSMSKSGKLGSNDRVVVHLRSSCVPKHVSLPFPSPPHPSLPFCSPLLLSPPLPALPVPKRPVKHTEQRPAVYGREKGVKREGTGRGRDGWESDGKGREGEGTEGKGREREDERPQQPRSPTYLAPPKCID